ncbi:hypothetical protein IVB16_21555 [Bradyrhizobium sp. 183]|uniref:hypothetical protein n=1 Tax=unclassified Bradyrhizobium TaxID=2631580 RepID=UPI0020001BE4|nr:MULTISPECIES: hypothetical protein [unclassified Bradyrhizobium]UPJ77514.1 hypothetical protein IVB17_21550 [Bradyrhizobium sp. 184]UPJ85308.1 hypothetical protein IVB16_21555 [Bradyrhizobium sp. 183]
MTPEEYLVQAERYRKALQTAKDAFTRHHLEVMEQSYRTLADSERALRKAGRIADALDSDGGRAK